MNMGYSLNKESFINELSRACDGLEIRYNAPVYLVGSYLSKGNEALDVDLVMVFTNEQLKRVFGPLYFENDFSLKNFRFRNKQKEWIWGHSVLGEWDIDFKEQSLELFSYHRDSTKYPLIKRMGGYADNCYLGYKVEGQE